MEYYFVVLQLPGGKELKFTDDDKVRENFWDKAGKFITAGKAPIVCVRQDTGVAESVRSHVTKGHYTTYLLLHLLLTKQETADKETIFKKAKEVMDISNYEALIDSDENFQLVVIDHLDINSFNVDMHA